MALDEESKTVYQYYGCKWHGCPCRNDRTEHEMKRFKETLDIEENMKNLGYNVVSVWECEKPELSEKAVEKQFTPYPYFIVYDFEALLKKLNKAKTEDLTIDNLHIPVSFAVNDNLTNNPSFAENSDPEQLIKDFVKDLTQRREVIIKKYGKCIPMVDEESLPKIVKNKWKEWVEQVPVFAFNGGKYDINMIKEYFVKTLADMNTVNVAKKENSYMFLTTPQFKFLDVKNYLAPGLSLDAWCKATMDVRLKSKFSHMNGWMIILNYHMLDQ